MNIVFTLVGSVIVFLVVFGFAAYSRFLQHKETMALAEKGLMPAEDPNDTSKNILRWGMIFSILGAVLVLAMFPFAWNNYWSLFLLGLLPLALGLGLTLIYVFAQDNPAPKEKKTKKPAPKAKKTTGTKPKKTSAKDPKKK